MTVKHTLLIVQANRNRRRKLNHNCVSLQPACNKVLETPHYSLLPIYNSEHEPLGL